MKNLDLLGVQIDGQHPVNAYGGHHVGNHLGRDGDPSGADPAILASIAKVGHYGGYTTRRRSAQGVNHQNEFDEIVIGGPAGALDNEDVFSAHVLIQFDRNLTVGNLLTWAAPRVR